MVSKKLSLVKNLTLLIIAFVKHGGGGIVLKEQKFWDIVNLRSVLAIERHMCLRILRHPFCFFVFFDILMVVFVEYITAQ